MRPGFARCLLAAASCGLLIAAACTSGGGDSADPRAAVRRFVEAWPAGGADLTATVTGPDAGRLTQMLREVGRSDVVRAELTRASNVPGEDTVDGTVALVFPDAGQLDLSIRATVDDGLVRAEPSAVSTELTGWETLRIEALGQPERGDIRSRSGSLLASGPRAVRVPARPALVPAIALIDDDLELTLGGKRGRRMLVGEARRVIAQSTPADGLDVTTSLDDSMQAAAETQLGSLPGALIAVDPRTGGIRAFVSNPEPSAPDRSPATSAYSPGSAFKIVTAAAALEGGAFEPHDEVSCPARMSLGERSITNFEGLAYGSVTFEKAFAVSCNTAFAQIGIAVGTVDLMNAARRLGIRPAPELDGPGTISLPRSRAELGVWSFGAAGSLVSPLQMASIGSTVASGGLLVSPRWTEPSDRGDRVLRATTADALIGMMEEVVRSGTGQRAAIPPVQVAGKTGTADPRADGGRSDAWFVGLAPSRDTQVVAVAFVPGGGLGGELTASLVREFFLATASW